MLLQALESHKFDTASDVWALGITFFELFTNAAVPYEGWQNKRVWVEVVSGYRLPCPAGCPDGFYKACVLPCWDADSVARPDASDILNKIRADFLDADFQKPQQRVPGIGDAMIAANDYVQPKPVAPEAAETAEYVYQEGAIGTTGIAERR